MKLGDLSVVGREIINSQVKAKPTQAPTPHVAAPNNSIPEESKSSDAGRKKPMRSQTQNGLPIDASNGLVFGFLEEDLVDALNENNQWKDRTNAMEKIESQLM